MAFPTNPSDGDFHVESGKTWVYVSPPGVWTIAGGTPITVDESDPVFLASEAFNITAGDTTNWDQAFAWGDHAQAGYLTADVDKIEKQYRYDGALAINTGTARLYVPADCTGYVVTGYLGTASSSGDVTVDVLIDGSLDDTLTIPALSTTATTSSPVAITAGSYITIDITGIGTGSSDLYLTLTFTRT